jgi:hypothetical protein
MAHFSFLNETSNTQHTLTTTTMTTRCQQEQSGLVHHDDDTMPARPTATVIEAKGLAEFFVLARCARGSSAAECCDQPAAPEKHIVTFQRGDSEVSAAGTEFDGDSPTATSRPLRKLLVLLHMPTEEARSVVHHDDFLEQLHVETRLRGVRQPRRQKLQSSMD